jgi:cytochrome c oxidase cbb3-type subunit III
MKRITIVALSALACALLATGCEREKRPTQAPAAASGTASHSYAARVNAPVKNRYEENAYAVSAGQTWYKAYNCAGCHGGGGGGGMGPPLMDSKWRYGSEPENIFQSISQGRPNGMPAFGEHVPEDQIWQLAAYVRSLSGQLREDVAPTRPDDLTASKPNSRRKKEEPTHEQTPAAE